MTSLTDAVDDLLDEYDMERSERARRAAENVTHLQD